MRTTILLFFIFCTTTVYALDYWDEGTVFIPGNGFEFTVNPDLTSDFIEINETCVIITGGNRSGTYCAEDPNVSLTPCLSEYVLTPYNDTRQWNYANFTGGVIQKYVPAQYYDYMMLDGMNQSKCAFNVTNNGGTQSLTFSMLFNGSMNYTIPYRVLEPFTTVVGRVVVDESTWVNNTYNWTRACLSAQRFTTNKTGTPSSMRMTFKFNNSADGEMDRYNGTEWVPINTTWGCQTSNWARLNFTKKNYTEEWSWDNVTLDYALLTGGPVTLTLNVTMGSTYLTKSVDVSSGGWKQLSMSVSGQNTSWIPEFRVELNGTADGVLVVDTLRLNTSQSRGDVEWLAGNGTVGLDECFFYSNTSVFGDLVTCLENQGKTYPPMPQFPLPNSTGVYKLNTSYQELFTVQPGETEQLSFWFNFTSKPLSGVVLDFMSLWYDVSGGGGII